MNSLPGADDMWVAAPLFEFVPLSPPRLSALAAGILAALCSGCGTIHNFEAADPARLPPPKKVFGGVREDIDFIASNPGNGSLLPLAIDAAVVLDLPISLAGDILTLPWTIRAARQRGWHDALER